MGKLLHNFFVEEAYVLFCTVGLTFVGSKRGGGNFRLSDFPAFPVVCCCHVKMVESASCPDVMAYPCWRLPPQLLTFFYSCGAISRETFETAETIDTPEGRFFLASNSVAEALASGKTLERALAEALRQTRGVIVATESADPGRTEAAVRIARWQRISELLEAQQGVRLPKARLERILCGDREEIIRLSVQISRFFSLPLLDANKRELPLSPLPVAPRQQPPAHQPPQQPDSTVIPHSIPRHRNSNVGSAVLDGAPSPQRRAHPTAKTPPARLVPLAKLPSPQTECVDRGRSRDIEARHNAAVPPVLDPLVTQATLQALYLQQAQMQYQLMAMQQQQGVLASMWPLYNPVVVNPVAAAPTLERERSRSLLEQESMNRENIALQRRAAFLELQLAEKKARDCVPKQIVAATPPLASSNMNEGGSRFEDDVVELRESAIKPPPCQQEKKAKKAHKDKDAFWREEVVSKDSRQSSSAQSQQPASPPPSPYDLFSYFSQPRQPKVVPPPAQTPAPKEKGRDEPVASTAVNAHAKPTSDPAAVTYFDTRLQDLVYLQTFAVIEPPTIPELLEATRPWIASAPDVLTTQVGDVDHPPENPSATTLSFKYRQKGRLRRARLISRRGVEKLGTPDQEARNVNNLPIVSLDELRGELQRLLRHRKEERRQLLVKNGVSILQVFLRCWRSSKICQERGKNAAKSRACTPQAALTELSFPQRTVESISMIQCMFRYRSYWRKHHKVHSQPLPGDCKRCGPIIVALHERMAAIKAEPDPTFVSPLEKFVQDASSNQGARRKQSTHELSDKELRCFFDVMCDACIQRFDVPPELIETPEQKRGRLAAEKQHKLDESAKRTEEMLRRVAPRYLAEHKDEVAAKLRHEQHSEAERKATVDRLTNASIAVQAALRWRGSCLRSQRASSRILLHVSRVRSRERRILALQQRFRYRRLRKAFRLSEAKKGNDMREQQRVEAAYGGPVIAMFRKRCEFYLRAACTVGVVAAGHRHDWVSERKLASSCGPVDSTLRWIAKVEAPKYLACLPARAKYAAKEIYMPLIVSRSAEDALAARFFQDRFRWRLRRRKSADSRFSCRRCGPMLEALHQRLMCGGFMQPQKFYEYVRTCCRWKKACRSAAKSAREIVDRAQNAAFFLGVWYRWQLLRRNGLLPIPPRSDDTNPQNSFVAKVLKGRVHREVRGACCNDFPSWVQLHVFLHNDADTPPAAFRKRYIERLCEKCRGFMELTVGQYLTDRASMRFVRDRYRWKVWCRNRNYAEALKHPNFVENTPPRADVLRFDMKALSVTRLGRPVGKPQPWILCPVPTYDGMTIHGRLHHCFRCLPLIQSMHSRFMQNPLRSTEEHLRRSRRVDRSKVAAHHQQPRQEEFILYEYIVLLCPSCTVLGETIARAYRKELEVREAKRRNAQQLATTARAQRRSSAAEELKQLRESLHACGAEPHNLFRFLPEYVSLIQAVFRSSVAACAVRLDTLLRISDFSGQGYAVVGPLTRVATDAASLCGACHRCSPIVELFLLRVYTVTSRVSLPIDKKAELNRVPKSPSEGSVWHCAALLCRGCRSALLSHLRDYMTDRRAALFIFCRLRWIRVRRERLRFYHPAIAKGQCPRCGAVLSNLQDRINYTMEHKGVMPSFAHYNAFVCERCRWLLDTMLRHTHN